MTFTPRKLYVLTISAWLAACGGGGDPTSPASSTVTPDASLGSTPAPAPAPSPTPSASPVPSPSPAPAPTPTPAACSGTTPCPSPSPTPTFQIDVTAQFNEPSDLAVDPAGNVYVADTKNASVRKIASSGDVTTVGGGFAANTLVATGATGQLYATADSFVYRVSSTGGKVVITELPNRSTGAPDIPMGLAVDAEGRVYVMHDFQNRAQQVERFNADGSVTTVFVGSTFALYRSLGVNAAGDIATAMVGPITDWYAIRYVPLATQGLADLSYDVTSYRTALPFDAVGDVAFDGAGNTYFLDWTSGGEADGSPHTIQNIRIRRIGVDRETITTLYDGAPPNGSIRTTMAMPMLGVSPTGVVFFSDPANHAIYKVGANGAATLYAGKPGQAGNSD
jgi:hypothetical protein